MLSQIVNAFKDHYDCKIVVKVDNKYFPQFIGIAPHYGRTQCLYEPSHTVVVMAMKDKKYLEFMKELQLNKLNLCEIADSWRGYGLICKVVEFNEKEVS